MEIQWHISPTSQYGKLYYPWYVMDYHNPWWGSTLTNLDYIWNDRGFWALLTRDRVPHCSIQRSPEPHFLSIKQAKCPNRGKITYCKVGETWETRGRGLQILKQLHLNCGEPELVCQKKITDGSVCSVRSVYFCSSAPDCQLFLAANGSCVSNCSPLRSS